MDGGRSASVRVRAMVKGRVQGVSFRACARGEARRLGLRGWVRNRADGSVELEAEGDPEAVDALVAWCRRGPPSARVESVEHKPLAATGDEDGFLIRGTE